MSRQQLTLIPDATTKPTFIFTTSELGPSWALHLDAEYSWVVRADAAYYRNLATVAGALADRLDALPAEVCS